MSKTTTAAVAGALALGTIGIGITAANAQTDDTTTAPTTATSTASPGRMGMGAREGVGPGGHHGMRGGQPGAMRGIDTAALAEKLGVSEADLTAALETVHEAQHTGPPSDEERANRQAEMVAALAEELGIDEAKVTAALDEVRAERQAEARTAFEERLDSAVADGTITAADKSSILKAFDAGVLGGQGPGAGRR